MIRRHRSGCPCSCTCNDFLKIELRFGKYKWKTIETVSEIDPGYIAWLFNKEVEGFHNIIPAEFAEECENRYRDDWGYDTGEHDDWGDRD
jgi:hypothetical protein